MDARAAVLAEVEAFLESGDDPTGSILQRIVERTAPDDPEAAEIIRAAAIPRQLSPTIVGVLRDRPDDLERNRALLGIISGLPLVRRRSDGSPAFQFDARRALLEWWRGTPGRLSAFRSYNLRLSAHWEAVARAVDAPLGNLARVETLLRSAAPARLAALRRSLERMESGPLLEALHHQVLADPSEASRWLFLRYETLESEARLGVAWTLLEAGEAELRASLPEGDPEETALWLAYYRARHDITLRRHAEARETLESLRTRAREPRLRSWILGALNPCLSAIGDLAGAEAVVREQLRIPRESGADDVNLPGALGQLAGILQARGRLDEAESSYREMAAAARENRRPGVARSAELRRAGVLKEMMRGKEARQIAAAILDEVLALPEADSGAGAEREEMRLTLEALLPLVALDAPLLDTLAAEAGAVVPSGADDLRVGLALQRLRALRTAGRLAEALAEVRRLAADPGTAASWRADLELEEALLLDDLGEIAAALDANTRLVAPEGVHPTWTSAAARTNRGLQHRALGRWDEAIADFRKARDEWTRIGQPRYRGTAILLEAATMERQDRVQGLEAFLAAGEARGAERDRAEGTLLLLRGRWEAADARFREGLRRTGGGDAVHLWLGRATLALLQGRWGDAADFVSRADAARGEWAPGAGAFPPARLLPPPEFRNPGVLEGVRTLLDDVAPEFQGFPERLADLHSVEGEFLLARGNAPEAARHLERGAVIQAALENPRASLLAGIDLLGAVAAGGVEGERGGPGWETSLARVLEMAELLRRAAAWSPDPAERAALDAHAMAVRVLHRQGSELEWRRTRARELFRDYGGGGSVPARRALLQLGYLYLRWGRRDAAVATLRGVIERGCRPWEESVLRARLVRTLLASASDPDVPGALRRGHLTEALDGIEDVEAGLSGVSPELPASAWLGVADARILSGDPAGALEAVERTAGFPVAARGRLGALLGLRMALIHAMAGDGARAAEVLPDALTREGAEPSALLAQAEVLTRLHPTARRILAFRLALMMGDRALPHPVANACRAASMDLSGPGGEAQADPPLAVSPIVVEIPPEVLQEHGGIQDDDPILVREIPALRERLRSEFALHLPGVVLLWGAEGRGICVRLRERVAGVRPGGMADVVPFLEWVLRGHLGDFIDLEEADDVLLRWAGSGPAAAERRKRRRDLLADPRAMIRFTAVLRALLAEEVPVGELDVVLQVLDHHPEADALTATEAVRKALASRLPGIRPDRRLHLLHPEMERAMPRMVRGEGGGRHLALEPAWGRHLLAALQALPDEVEGSTTLVVSLPSLRPWVRQVVAQERPRSAVVASDELPEGIDPGALPRIPETVPEGAW